MKNIFLVLCFTLFVSISFSQKIFETKVKSEANKIVFIVHDPVQADLRVYITSNKFEVKKDFDSGIWYFTTNEFDADYKVFFTKNIFEADIKVSFTLNKFFAGKPK